jgi:hypothetical protein
MPSDCILQRLLEQVEGSHFTFIRFVGRIPRHEWDWSPDEGIQSAHDVVADLIREELRIFTKLEGGGDAQPVDPSGVATPSTASSALRWVRERTLDALRRSLAGGDEALERTLVQSAVSLAQLDAHAVGALGILHRLIDPSRAKVSPR